MNLSSLIKFEEETNEMLHLKHGAETWENPKIDPRCFENYEMRCWRRMECIS